MTKLSKTKLGWAVGVIIFLLAAYLIYAGVQPKANDPPINVELPSDESDGS